MSDKEHFAAYNTILEISGEKFAEGEDYLNGENTIYVDKPGKNHDFRNWIVDLYNIMQVFFRER